MRSLRIPRSPKVIVGLIILGIFVVLTVIGPWIAPYDPLMRCGVKGKKKP